MIIATHNRAELLVTRAVPSVLNQTYQNFELIIVADRCTDDTRDRVQAIKDPRIKFVELTDRPPLPDDLHARWRVAAAAPRNKGLEIATGDWLTFLDDDDEFTPDHIEVLLKKALEGYDFVYGNILMIMPNGEQRIIGKYPPEHGHIGTSSYICSAKYKHLKFNTDATATWEPEDWNFIRRVIEAGARVCYINKVVYIHYRPVRAWEKQRQKLPFTGERFLPWIPGAQIHYEHLHRYAFASQFVKGKRVLDLASGEGYGANMLAKQAEHVIGIEIDKNTVEHARAKYIRSNLEFIQGSILDVPIGGEKLFDVITCFEAIEHIAEHDKLLSEVKRLLKEDGIFILSTPNKAVYSDAPSFDNPFHVRELYFDEFQNLLKRYFKHLQLWGQRVYAGSNIWALPAQERSTSREFLVRKGDFEFHILESTLDGKEPMYLVAIASDASLRPSDYHLDSWLVDISNILLNDYERQVAQLNASLQEKETQIAQLNASLQEKETQLQQIQRGIVMQLLRRYQRIAEKIFPAGTRRRYYYELVLTGIRVLLNEGWKSFLRKALKPLCDSTVFSNNISKKVSIIVPNYNGEKHLGQCIESLHRIDFPGNWYEVIVVDNGSEDSSRELIRSTYPFVRLIESHVNLGFAGACNLGISHSKGEYIVVLNNDTVVDPAWLGELVATAESDPDIGVVGSKLLFMHDSGVIQNAGSYITTRGDGGDIGFREPDDGQYDSVRETMAVCGASMLIKRKLLEEIGGFDNDFFAYYEDTDLCYRTRLYGKKVVFNPKSVVYHVHAATLGEWSSNFIFFTFRNKLLMHFKNAPLWFFAKVLLLYCGQVLHEAILKRVNIRIHTKVILSFIRKLPRFLVKRLWVRLGVKKQGDSTVMLRLTVAKSKMDSSSVRKVCVYNAYLPTMGGGEKLTAYVIEYINKLFPEARIDLVCHPTPAFDRPSLAGKDFVAELESNFGASLKRTRVRLLDIGHKSLLNALKKIWVLSTISKDYDIFINITSFSLQPAQAKFNIYYCMFPFAPGYAPGFLGNTLMKLLQQRFLKSYHLFLAISQYTQQWMDKYWGTNSYVLYPPVEPVVSSTDMAKENIILNVGRFFSPSEGHNKKQDVLIKAFIDMVDKGMVKNWKLALAGRRHISEPSLRWIAEVEHLAAGYPIEFYYDLAEADLHKLYSSAKIYWHATGFGEDQNAHPERFEHFGISTIEAMQYGAVPVVINAGGQPEIVAHGRNGFLWSNVDELIHYTKLLMDDNDLWRELSQSASQSSRVFSKEVQLQRLARLLGSFYRFREEVAAGSA